MKWVTLLLAIVGLPLLGALCAAIGAAPSLSVDSLRAGAASAAACAREIAPNPISLTCETATNSGRLMLLSVVTLAGAVMLVIVTRVLSLLLGLQRQLLAFGFGPVAFVSVLMIGAVALGQAGLLIGSITVLFERFAPLSMTAVLTMAGVMALAAGSLMLRSLAGLFRSRRMFIAAQPVSLYDFPRLGLIIRDVSKSLKARMPDNVLIGLEPSFFATSTLIQTPFFKAPLKGQTLFLSLPLLQQFTEGELRAVIGHELGHFSGGDTAFSKRFSPAYGGLIEAAENLNDPQKPVTRLIATPARRLIQEVVAAFDVVRLRIGRGREHRADESGVRVSSPQDAAYSLLKASVLGAAWNDHVVESIDRGRRGRFSRNLVRNFAERVRLDLERNKLSPLVRFAFGESVRHPADTHPATEDRIAAMGLDLVKVSEQDALKERFFVARKVTDGLDNMRGLEETLTSLHYHLFSELWPDESEGHDAGEVFNSLLCDVLALMVTADGKVDDRELERAETKSRAIFGDFDADTFRDRCQHPDHIPPLDKIVDFASKLLTPKGAENLKLVLRQIAEADGEIEAREAAMLEQIEATLIIAEPSGA